MPMNIDEVYFPPSLNDVLSSFAHCQDITKAEALTWVLETLENPIIELLFQQFPPANQI